jgi:hypothetical protein
VQQSEHPGKDLFVSFYVDKSAGARQSRVACLLLFGIPARQRGWRTMLGMLALFGALSGGVFACGGGGNAGGGTSNPGTTAGTYTITVTGTSGTLTATTPITLTVQ